MLCGSNGTLLPDIFLLFRSLKRKTEGKGKGNKRLSCNRVKGIQPLTQFFPFQWGDGAQDTPFSFVCFCEELDCSECFQSCSLSPFFCRPFVEVEFQKEWLNLQFWNVRSCDSKLWNVKSCEFWNVKSNILRLPIHLIPMGAAYPSFSLLSPLAPWSFHCSNTRAWSGH